MLTAIPPTSPVLKKYIDTFYIFSVDKPGNLRYLAFPHTNTGLSFFKDTVITRAYFEVEISGGEKAAAPYCIEILGKYTRPVLVSYHGRVEEIAIVFTPLGVNRFIGQDFMTVAPQYSQPFMQARWLEIAPVLFASHDPTTDLETFLLSVMSDEADLLPIEKALRLLEDNLSDYSMTDIAAQTDLGFKTFQRHFTKAVGCSPTDYRRIARFRSALRSKLNSKELKSLTSISYENNYSDQSYFIREFRKLTGQNPKHFFREVSLVDGEKIAWEIL